MLRSIMSAIRSALRSAGRALARLMIFPWQLLGFFGSPDFDDVPEPAPPEDLSAGRKPAPATYDAQANYDRIASQVRLWCAHSLLAGSQVALPPQLPIAVREWLPGLSRPECDAIIEAEKQDVSAFLNGQREIPGVRPVGCLPGIDWPPEIPATVSEVSDDGPGDAPARPLAVP
jgi:hypothetical protein